MIKLLSCMVLSLGLLTGLAHADEAKLYYGLGISDGSVDISNGEDSSLGTVSATLGMQFLGFIGVELEVGAASDQSNSILSDPLVSYQSIMFRLQYRWDRTAVYLLGGQARMDINKQFNNSDAGNVYGLGISLFGNETTALNFHVLDFDDGAFKTATIGIQYYFDGYR